MDSKKKFRYKNMMIILDNSSINKTNDIKIFLKEKTAIITVVRKKRPL